MKLSAAVLSAWAALVYCLATGPLVQAQQSRAMLGGRVIDAQGASVPEADVVVTSDDTGVKQQRMADPNFTEAVFLRDLRELLAHGLLEVDEFPLPQERAPR